MKKNHYASTRKTILSNMILVPLIPFLFSLGIGYYYFTTQIETSTISSMKRIITDHSHMIDSFLYERKADLELIYNSYSFSELVDSETLRKVFEDLQKCSNAFVDLGVFNSEGIHVAYYGPYKLTGKEYGETEWFKKVTNRGFFISDIFLGYRNVPHFIIAVAKREKGVLWVLRATIDTYMFSSLVGVHIGRTGESFIINKEGLFQTDRRSGGTLMSRDTDELTSLSDPTGIKTFIHKGKDGRKYLYATTWLKDGDWLLVVRQEKEDAFRSLRYASYLILLISIIGGAVIIGLAFYLTKKITGRMEHKDHEKEKLSHELIRAGRLAELGEMSAGFAHEINNPLQIIESEYMLIKEILAELIENGDIKRSESIGEMEDSLEQIHFQIRRSAEITQSILKFGRKSDFKEQDIKVGKVLMEVVKMVEKKANVHGISIKLNIDEDSRSVYGDPGHLQQVFLNLFNNAMDAIIAKHGSAGGEIEIKTDLVEKGEIIISVTDNGRGISTENMNKIFSPFFTTKPVGKGTGLGLSVCYGIINEMGGKIDVKSAIDKGTSFFIHLPVSSSVRREMGSK